MKGTAFAAAMGLLLGPTQVGAQIERAESGKQKAWLLSNFRSGISDCSLRREGDGFALSGVAAVSFTDLDGDNDGYDFSVNNGGGAVPIVAAHAINTAGAGTQSGHSAGQVCELRPSPRGTIPAGRTNEIGGATADPVAGCSLSGDPDAPVVRFTIPLSSFGGAAGKTYVGHVTLMKREASTPAVSEFFSKKGYDSWKAHSDMAAARSSSSSNGIAMKVMATCDVGGLSRNGSATRSGYDLAVGK